MESPELSVIVPTYGRADAVARAVQSALQQDVDLEVIIVDDGSDTPIVVGLPRTRVVRLATNQGPAAARNAGASAARAPWLAFLDSDDVWTAHSLRARLDTARAASDSESTIWCAGFVDVWPDRRGAGRIPKPSARLVDFVSGCWSCPGSTALLSRAAWQRSGGQDPNLRRLEDYDWLIRWGKSRGQLAVHEGIAAEITRGGRAEPDVVETTARQLRARHGDLTNALKRPMESYLQLERAAARLHHGAWLSGGTALARSWLLHPRLQVALEPFWRREGAL